MINFRLKMSNPIWKIGLFNKLSKDKAECIECKSAGRTKYEFELSKASIKSLVIHLNSKHADEYSEKYKALVQQKLTFDESSSQTMSKFVNVLGSGNFSFQILIN
jgi:spore coat polysaccharide biosynthesis predicted glycosyltransferase SpsG